jgi:hypothetical protein
MDHLSNGDPPPGRCISPDTGLPAGPADADAVSTIDRAKDLPPNVRRLIIATRVPAHA